MKAMAMATRRGWALRPMTLGLVLALMLPALAEPAAELMPVPADLQIPLIFKILTYDRLLEERGKPELTFAVLYSPDAASVQAKDDALAILNRIVGKTVKKIPIRFVTIAYTTAAALQASLAESRVDVLYISPGFSERLDELSAVCEQNHVITATGVPEYVGKGVGIGIGLHQNKPQILINLPACKRGGSQFDSSMLRIAQVIK